MQHLQQPTPFALLEKRAFGQWIQNKVDGAWNGVRDNVVNPMKQTAQGVATNAQNAWHDVKQVGRGVGNAVGGTAEQAWDVASAPVRTGIGAVQGGVQGYKRTGTLGGALGGAADGGWNTAKDMGNQIGDNAEQIVGGYKDIGQGTINGVSNAVKGTLGTQKLMGQALLAQPMAAYHGIAGAAAAPGASPAAPKPAAPAAPAAPAGNPAGAPGTPGALAQGPPAPAAPAATAPAAPAAAPAAPAAPAGPTPEQIAQFQKGVGGSYDPKSWLDRNKMNALIGGQQNWADQQAARSAGAGQQYAWMGGGAQKAASAFAILG